MRSIVTFTVNRKYFMNLPLVKPGFLERVRSETVSKLVTLVLVDRDFTDDVREAPSLDEYLKYIGSKKKRTIYETLFFIAPKDEQKNVWKTIRGGTDE